jgi:mycobactin lysine-N-oxygenase
MSGSVDNIIVLGAGAKAAALTAKAAVLRDLGHPVPEILVVEPTEVGSAWTGAGGMTSGDLTLGTPPEKDVGFPYMSAQSWGDAGAVDAEMYRRFSWAGYLIGRGSYHEWIDRGKPHPRHREWGEYLAWVSRESGMKILPGIVTHIELRSRWAVRVAANDGDSLVESADGLVITGYGTVPAGAGAAVELRHSLPEAAGRYLDVAAFWHRTSENLPPSGSRIIVVGAGEAAAGIVEHLLREGRHDVAVVCPGYAIYSRGESLYENELYSNPDRWPELPIPARREFISRTDRGVFSVKVLAALADLGRVEIIGGRVADVQEFDTCVQVTVERVSEKVQCHADFVIEACGRDAAWFLRLMSNSVLASLADALDGQVDEHCLHEAVAHDLSVRGLTPRLHVPNLAALMQGPGFPAMTCLSLLSDRILSSYLPR